MKRLVWFFAILLFSGAVIAGKQAYLLYHNESIDLKVPVTAARATRAVYPFSVIPGGVLDAEELADSITHDPVARAHYQGINPERLWPTVAQKPMFVYVSYRKGNSVFWTNHLVKVAAGEALLTDGTNLIRGRCGNRIAFKRPAPLPEVPTEEPPPDVVFETPVPALTPPVVTQPVPPVVLAQRTPGHPSPVIWTGVKPTQGYVPEPGTMALTGSGLLAVASFFRRRWQRGRGKEKSTNQL